MRVISAFWLLAIAVFTGFVIPLLLQDGMFSDGQGYAAIAKNLADGKASFWHPLSSGTWERYGSPWFLEQPMLGYGIQSIFFSLLGDSIYTERIYSLLMAWLTAMCIVLIWRELFRSTDLKILGWLPVMLWIIMPVVSWSIQNNMLENTMGMFTTLAVWLAVRARAGNKRVINPWLLLSGVAIFCATFTKGFPGFFPVVVPLAWWVIFRASSFRSALLRTAILITLPAIVYGVLLLDSTARESLTIYLQGRVLNSIEHVTTGGGRLFLLARWAAEMSIPVCFVVALLIAFRLRHRFSVRPAYKQACFFALISICGTVPLIVTLEQRPFYLATALPFIGLALAALVAPTVLKGLRLLEGSHVATRMIKVTTLLLLCGSVLLSVISIGKTKRDHKMLHDVHVIGEIIPQGSTVSATSTIRWTHWNLQAYLMRHYGISVDVAEAEQPFFISEKVTEEVPKAYDQLKVRLEHYVLYEQVSRE